MTQIEMQDVMDTIFERCQKFRDAGQAEYAHKGKDAFENFNRISEALGLDRKTVLWVYFMKHIHGIEAHIKGHTSQREDVTGRIGDAITYLCLLEGMVVESRTKEVAEDKECEAETAMIDRLTEVPTLYGTCRRCGADLVGESQPCPDGDEECLVNHFRSWCPTCNGAKRDEEEAHATEKPKIVRYDPETEFVDGKGNVIPLGAKP